MIPWPIESLLPHAAPMLMLDQVLSHDADSVIAAVTLRPDHPFATPDGVPAHVGIELMAQTCGLWAGIEARTGGEAARVGFLLGTRRYKATRPWFAMGERLEIHARVVFRDQGMGVFDCQIKGGDEVVALAQLTVYQPADGHPVPGET